jgi:hypothetical protein
MNDKANNHGSGTVPIGLELHYMYYQYDQPGDIGNTTFMDVKMINRGVQTLYDFHVGLIMDGDLGNSQDDYVGCDSLRNLQYYYNDSNDEQGYGLNPPSFGAVCLTDNLTSAVSLSGQNGFPISGAGSYNVMKGLNPNGDRRTSMAINIGTLTPAMAKKMTYAFVYNRSGNDNIENVDELLITADLVQNFHDISTDGNCSQSILGINDSAKEIVQFKLFPNPTSGDFQIESGQGSKFSYSISDMSGREMVNGKSNISSVNISLDAPAGVYFVTVSTKNSNQIDRLVIK